MASLSLATLTSTYSSSSLKQASTKFAALCGKSVEQGRVLGGPSFCLPKWPQFGRIRGNLGHFGANFARRWSSRAKFGGNQATVSVLGGYQANLGRRRAKIGRVRAKVSQVWATVVRTWPNCGRFRAKFGRHQPGLDQKVWSNRATLDRFRENVGRF